MMEGKRYLPPLGLQPCLEGRTMAAHKLLDSKIGSKKVIELRIFPLVTRNLLTSVIACENPK